MRRCAILAGLGVWRSLVARSVRVGEVPSSNLGTPMSTFVPFTCGFVALCAVQAVTVLGPRPSPRLVRHPLLGLVPLIGLGGVGLLIAGQPSTAQKATDLPAIATPIAAFAGIVASRGRPRWLGLLAPVL